MKYVYISFAWLIVVFLLLIKSEGWILIYLHYFVFGFILIILSLIFFRKYKYFNCSIFRGFICGTVGYLVFMGAVLWDYWGVRIPVLINIYAPGVQDFILSSLSIVLIFISFGIWLSILLKIK